MHKYWEVSVHPYGVMVSITTLSRSICCEIAGQLFFSLLNELLRPKTCSFEYHEAFHIGILLFIRYGQITPCSYSIGVLQ
jgi:hypothetical protein